MSRICLLCLVVVLLSGCGGIRRDMSPRVVVLGIAQDGGVPQAGSFGDRRWGEANGQRLVVCLGLIDPRTDRVWMFDATPDFRRQLYDLHAEAQGAAWEWRASNRPGEPRPAALDGIFLTHAHIGHYTGLMFLGHESMGAGGVPVYAMPRMRGFLEGNGPWDQLVRFENIELRTLGAGEAVHLGEGLSVTPILVPHRQEYSEVVGYRIDGPTRSVLYIPDIDSWEEFDAMGTRIEDMIARVDIAYLDGTFFANGEIPGRDMRGFPHPFITNSLERFAALPEAERAKVRFLHLNHTNPALHPSGPAQGVIRRAGMRVAAEGETEGL
ncbi:MAG: MBL fold metallo-hydrolase [Planctomycetota bacterium]|nr:MBL fold metallo-hydrolase [Planctomycetota bacterium]